MVLDIKLDVALGDSCFGCRDFEVSSSRLKELVNGSGAAVPKGRPGRPDANKERRRTKRIARCRWDVF